MAINKKYDPDKLPVKKIKKSEFRSMTTEEVRNMLGDTKVHAISIQKGGTGKTLTTSDLGYTLASMGYKVLLIDTDPQASLSMLCGVDVSDMDIKGLQNLYNIFAQHADDIEVTMEDIEDTIIHPTFTKTTASGVTKEIPFGFDLIPCNIKLAEYDLMLNQMPYGAYTLYLILQTVKEESDYDFIFIDCPPGLGPLTYSALAAAIDGVIVPVNLEVVTILGAQNLVSSIKQVQWAMDDKVNEIHKGILGILKNKYIPRYTVQREISDVVESFFPINIFSTSIPSKTACDIAHSVGRFYSEYDSTARRAFKELAEEIIVEDILREETVQKYYAGDLKVMKYLEDNALVKPFRFENFGTAVWDEVQKKKLEKITEAKTKKKNKEKGED